MNRPTTECLVVSDKKKVSWTSGFMANDGSDGQESNANSEETESIAFANQIEWVRQSVTTYSLHLHFGSRGHWWRQAPSCNRGMEHVIEEWRNGGVEEWMNGARVLQSIYYDQLILELKFLPWLHGMFYEYLAIIIGSLILLHLFLRAVEKIFSLHNTKNHFTL